MAFTQEEIITKEDLELLDSYEFINPINGSPVNSKVCEPKGIEYFHRSWAIDRERNAFLKVLTSSNGNMPSRALNFYALVWNNNIIIFACHRNYIENENSLIVNDIITKIFAPICLDGCDDEVINIIKESIESVTKNLKTISELKLSMPSCLSIKYNLKFSHKPQYMLGGNDYKDKNVLTVLLALTINDIRNSNKSIISKILDYLKKILQCLFLVCGVIYCFKTYLLISSGVSITLITLIMLSIMYRYKKYNR